MTDSVTSKTIAAELRKWSGGHSCNLAECRDCLNRRAADEIESLQKRIDFAATALGVVEQRRDELRDERDALRQQLTQPPAVPRAVPLEEVARIAAWVLPELRNHRDAGPECHVCIAIGELEAYVEELDKAQAVPHETDGSRE